MNTSGRFGATSEETVANYLQSQGYAILARNYKKQYGEIDLIAQKRDVIAFVEVKARRNPLFDMGELISHSKQKKIIAVAKTYLAAHTNSMVACRFDVALINESNTANPLTYIADAFTEPEYYPKFY